MIQGDNRFKESSRYSNTDTFKRIMKEKKKKKTLKETHTQNINCICFGVK